MRFLRGREKKDRAQIGIFELVMVVKKIKKQSECQQLGTTAAVAAAGNAVEEASRDSPALFYPTTRPSASKETDEGNQDIVECLL